MKIKIVGFKVGQSRPTANRAVSNITFCDAPLDDVINEESATRLGIVLADVLSVSDFVSIRRVDE